MGPGVGGLGSYLETLCQGAKQLGLQVRKNVPPWLELLQDVRSDFLMGSCGGRGAWGGGGGSLSVLISKGRDHELCAL